MKRTKIVLYLLAFVAVAACNYVEHREGNEIVGKVEQFRKMTGHLPNRLSEIGVKEKDGCPCYCKTGNDNYILWYGTTLGKSDTYDSRTKEWSEASGAVCAAPMGQ